MQDNAKHMAVVLGTCAVFVALNIIAVTTGAADRYYSEITEWLAFLH
jgi:hypothetical protein